MDTTQTIIAFITSTAFSAIVGAAIKAYVDSMKINQSIKKIDNDFKRHESSGFIELFQNFMGELRMDREERKKEMFGHIDRMNDLITQLKNERSASEYWQLETSRFLHELSEIKEKVARQEEQIKLCEERNSLQDILNKNHKELMIKIDRILPQSKGDLI